MNLAALSLVLINPWQVGPAPSAHETQVGWNVGADAALIVGRSGTLFGGRGSVAASPTPWFWTGLSAEYGSAFRFCPDCESFATTWTARVSPLRFEAFHVAAWSSLSFINGLFEWIPGLSLEGGWERLRFDLATPLWSTYDLISTLRSTPELGISWIWDDENATRLAVVGVEPTVALAHRYQWSWAQLQAQLRYGEEGPGAELGLRFYW